MSYLWENIIIGHSFNLVYGNKLNKNKSNIRKEMSMQTSQSTTVSSSYSVSGVVKYSATESNRLAQYIKAMERENKSLNEERVLMENYINQLKKQADAHKGLEIEFRNNQMLLKEEIGRLVHNNQKLITEMTQIDKKIAFLTKEINMGKQNMRLLANEKNKTEQQLKSQIIQIVEQNKKSLAIFEEEKKKQVYILNKRLGELLEEGKKYSETVASQNRTINYLQQKIKQYVQIIKSLQDKIHQIERQNKLNSKNWQIEKNKRIEIQAVSEEKIKKYEENIKSLQTLNDNLRNINTENYRIYQSDQANKTEQQRKLGQQIRDYERNLTYLEGQVKLYEETVKHHEQTIQQLTSENLVVTQNLRMEEGAKIALYRQMEEMKKNLQGKIDRLAKQLETANESIQFQHQIRIEWEKQRQNLLAKTQSDSQQIAQLESKIAAMKKNIEDEQMKKALLHKNLEKTEKNHKEYFESWKKNQIDFEQFIEYIKNSIKDLQSMIDQQNKELFALRSTNQILKTEILEGISKVSIEGEKEKELIKTKTELAAIKGKLAEKQRQIATSAFKIGFIGEDNFKDNEGIDGVNGIQDKRSKKSINYSEKRKNRGVANISLNTLVSENNSGIDS